MSFNPRSVPYYQLSVDDHQRFVSFLQDARLETTQPAHINMWDENWVEKNNTLPYILEYTDRFKANGYFHVLFDGDRAIACSGAYRSSFSDDIAILGTRTWIHKDYRHKLLTRDYLLPVEKAWAIEQGFKIIVLTFNEYNKNLRKLWIRKRLGENRPDRTEKHFGFKNAHSIEYPLNIQYTKQYVIYEKLDDSWDFDWKTIEYKND
jgi:hypothetical protein